MSKKFWVVLSHTYLSKLKTKSFIVTTAVILVLLLVVSNLPKIIDLFDKKGDPTIGVIDHSGQYYQPYADQLKKANAKLITKEVKDEKKAKKLLDSGKVDGYLIIEEDAKGMPKGIYKADSISDETVSNELSQHLTSLKNRLYASQLKLSDSKIAELYAPAAFEKVATKQSAKTQEELNQARGLVYVILFVIYFGVLMYAGMIASEVAGEKTSRVMEILISSISPVQQMFAKILGVALLSMTQLLLFFGVGYFAIKKSLADMPGDFFSVFGFGDTSISTILYAILFTLLGYFIYATLAAFLGSLVSRVEEVQSMITPMTYLIIIAFMMSMFGLSNPEAGFVKVGSFIPPFTPMLMFLRVGMVEVPFLEVAISVVLCLATIIALAVFGAKVYRGGVLMYGKGGSLKNIKRALEMTKK
ncbi:ABC transporter permease [Bacillus testis]|uniref:ABC transporter permease n=1 Tax=Bacillus testis TaxID=1622072 RepID=UPI00067F5EFB|nr:ABC transporter permease [Bacillus testis]